MSDRIRNPSAVTLSAQNLAFAPQSFIGVSSSGANISPHFTAPIVGQQNERAMVSADMEKQAQKMKEYEQQRLRLQQLNAKGSLSANPDAMIAQMLGKSLTPNVRPVQLGYSHMQNIHPNSAIPMNPYPAMIPRSAPAVEGLHTAHLNRPFGPTFMPNQFVSSPLPSAVHLSPKDFEHMVQQFANAKMDNINFPTNTDRRFLDQSHQNSKPGNTNDGVFVIPTMPGVMTPDGQYYQQRLPVPSWINDKTTIPEEYLKYLNACLRPNRPFGADFPDTGLVYVLLRTSGLSNEILGTIWALTNRSQPGQLTKEEFFAALALVALAQENGTVASLEILSTMARLPIPKLSLAVLNLPPMSQSTPTLATSASTTSNISNPSFDRRVSSGSIEFTQPASSGMSSVSAPLSNATNDDFGDFTDFQAGPSPALTTATPNLVENVASKDPYDALRILAEPSDNNVNNDGAKPIENDSAKPNLTNTIPAANIAFSKLKSYDPFGNFANAPTPMTPITFSDRIHETTSVSEINIAIVRSQTEPKISLFSKDVPKKDLNELLRQTFESLDLGGNNVATVGPKSDDDSTSIKSESKEPSIHSLDLQSIKHFDLEQQESGDVLETRSNRSPAGSVSLVDRYAAFRENGISNGESNVVEKHVDAWTKCLEACLQLLKQAEKIFARATNEQLRKEILATDRGSKYLCGNVQIYRVSRRIRLSLQTMAFQTDKLIDLLTELDSTWNNLCSFVAFSAVLPTQENLDFRNALVQITSPMDDHKKYTCCGVCLLNVDATCKTDQGSNFDYKLNYGGRQYHAQCANLWINCIDSVLPALDVSCLL